MLVWNLVYILVMPHVKWWLLFLTLLICISCHMHHNYFITLMHLCMQIASGISFKCVIGI
jgi:hypothetical protein